MDLVESKNDAELYERAGQHLVEMVSEFDAKCLVLLSGGSAIKTYQPLVDYIASGQGKNLVIGLVDERYGEVGHEDSNARQIGELTSLWSACEEAGVEYRLPLQGYSLEQSALDYDAWLHHVLAMCPIRIAVLGMGLDGHTAGMLPTDDAQFSSFFIEDETKLYTGYSSNTEFDIRLTMRIPLMQQFTRVLLIASGKDKRKVFDEAMDLDVEQEVSRLPITSLQLAVDAVAYISQ